MTETLTLPPSQSGYSVQFGSGVIATEIAGGHSRYMSDTLTPSHRVRLQWRTNRAGYDYLANFYKNNVGRAFNIQLIIDTPVLELYKAFFEPDGFRLSSIQGGTYVVTAQLEIEFNDRTAFDRALATLNELYGTDLPAVLLCFHELVVKWEAI